jgi:hypothetical protein
LHRPTSAEIFELVQFQVPLEDVIAHGRPFCQLQQVIMIAVGFVLL